MTLKEKNIVDLTITNEGVFIKALNFIGLFSIRCSSGSCKLVIRPKIPVKSLLEIILFSMEGISLKDLDELSAEIGIDENVNALDIITIALIRRFILQLNEALAWGFLRTSEDHLIVSSSIEGQLIVTDSINTIARTGLPIVVSSCKSFTNKNTINSLIKTLCERLLGKKWRPFVGKRGVQVINSAITELYDVETIDYQIEDIDIHYALHDAPLERGYLHSLAILSYVILSFVRTGDMSEIPCVYISIDMIFERFVRKLFSEKSRPYNLIVRKATNEDKKFLLDEPYKMHGLVPDLVIFKSKTLLSVGDMKYSLQIPENDTTSHNQVFTYMIRWGCSHAILVYPCIDDKPYQSITTFKIKETYKAGESYLHFLRIDFGNINTALETVEDVLKKIQP
jgi:hypothetical protein